MALFSFVIATSGCGKSGSNTVAGVPATGTTVNNVVGTSNGGIAISFYGNEAYYDYNPYNGQAVVFSAGQLPTNSPTFQVNDAPYGSWLFLNGSRPGGAGVIAMGPPTSSGSSQQLFGQAQLDPGTTLSVSLVNGSSQFHYNIIAGTLTLSQQSFQRLFNGSAPSVIGLAIDLGVSGNMLTSGGILIYTSQDSSGYHGKFLPFF